MQGSKVEEITDMMADKAYTAKDSEGNFIFYKGKVLKFDYEGSITTLRITKIDRQAKRMWAEHIEIHDQAIVRSHYGHAVDITEEAKAEHGAPFCTDCQVPVIQPSTEDGEVKAQDRADRTLSDGTIIED